MPLHVRQFNPRFLESDAKHAHIRPRRRARLDLLLLQIDDLFLKGNLFLQKRLALPIGDVIQQAGPHLRPHLPRRRRDIQPR